MIRDLIARFARKPPLPAEDSGDSEELRRSVDIDPSGFDWALYLDRYPDLRAAGLSSEDDARSHWISHGRSEGRWSSPLRRPPRETLVCPSVDSLYLRASGDLVCWCDAGNDTVLQGAEGNHHYGHDVWLSEPYERVRRTLWNGRMPFAETCQRCMVLKSRGLHSSEAVDRRRIRVLQIEPSYKCSLDCPGCVPLSVRRAAPPGNLETGLLRRVLSDFVDAGITIEAVDLQGHGEPLMHPKLWGLTRLVKELHPEAFVSLTTNCQATLKDQHAPDSVDEIVCAIDGASDTSYERYRIGGSFSLAVRFMRDFAAAARDGHNPTLVVWKYVLFEHNSSEAELRRAHAIAVESGVKELRFVLTRNGPVARSIHSQLDLPEPPDGLRQSFECHAPDLADFELRLRDGAAALATDDLETAGTLTLSIARGLHRFYRNPSDLDPESRRILDGLLDLEQRLGGSVSAIVNDLVDHLRPSESFSRERSSNRPAPPRPPVHGCLDSIQATKHGLVVGGWMLSEDGSPLTVEIEPLNGPKTTAESGPRPDVARAHSNIIGAQSSGWSATLARVDGEGPEREWNFVIRGYRGDRPVLTTHVIHSMNTRHPYLPLILADGELLETSPEAEVS